MTCFEILCLSHDTVFMIYTDVIITVYLILSGNHDQIYTNLRNEERFKLNSDITKAPSKESHENLINQFMIVVLKHP